MYVGDEHLPEMWGDSIIMIRILSPTMISCDVTRLFNKFLKILTCSNH